MLASFSGLQRLMRDAGLDDEGNPVEHTPQTMPDRALPYQSPVMQRLQGTPPEPNPEVFTNSFQQVAPSMSQVAPSFDKMAQIPEKPLTTSGGPFTLDTSKRYGGAWADMNNSLESGMDARVEIAGNEYRKKLEEQDRYAQLEKQLVTSIGGAAHNAGMGGNPINAASGLQALKGLLPTWQNMFAAKPVAKGGGMGTPTGEFYPGGGSGGMNADTGKGPDSKIAAMAEAAVNASGETDPQKRMIMFRNTIESYKRQMAGATAEASGLASNTGSVADAKVKLAFDRAAATAKAGFQTGLSPSPTDPTISNVEARSRAEFMGKGLPADVQDVLVGFGNIKGITDSIRNDFQPGELQKYVGFISMPAHRVGQIALEDPQFAKFRNLVDQLQLYAFDMGGKQLTPMEKQVTDNILSLGNEYSWADFMANLNGLDERMGRIRDYRTKYGTMTRGEASRTGDTPSTVTPTNPSKPVARRERYNPATRKIEAY
jgi:hypothetical protein